MKHIMISIFVSCLLIIGPNNVDAQVTIGMGTPSAHGAILDLKNIVPTGSQDPLLSANKGMGLPCVFLEELGELYPMFDGSEKTYTDLKKQHTGLIVYNTNNTIAPFDNIDLGSGIYAWDGGAWNKIVGQQVSSSVADITMGTGMINPMMYSYDDLYEPNSYVVKVGTSSENIKVAKAYAMWEKYSIPANSKVGANKSLSEYTTTTLPNTVTLQLLWQDENGLIPASGGITTAGSGRDMTFKVNPDSGKTGNAVIGASIGGVIRWSWHIWVTNYDPNATNLTLINTTEQNAYTFMDRNLGATSNTMKNIGSMGLLYQWGRKDPFPGASVFTANEPKPIYNAAGTSLTEDGTGIKKAKVPATASGNLNLVNAISNPMTFYTYNENPFGGTGTHTLDWYTNMGYSNLAGDRTEVMNDQLWDEDGRKTPFDPCPRGWHVPTWKNSNSSWLYVPANADPNPSNYGSTSNFDTDFALQFTGKSDYNLGHYPAAGHRSKLDGNLEKVGFVGYLWSATVYTEPINYSYSFIFDGDYVFGWNPTFRAEGYSVRCVKE